MATYATKSRYMYILHMLLLYRKLSFAILAASVFSPAGSISSQYTSNSPKDDLVGKDDLGATCALEAGLLPSRIKERYLETLLEWAIQTISRSITTGKAEYELLHEDINSWQLVSTLLHINSPAPTAVLTGSLLTAISAIASDSSIDGANLYLACFQFR
jgi:hypothetical protein